MTKWQIHKDMVRSFNGECSVDKLCHVYNKSHGLVNVYSNDVKNIVGKNIDDNNRKTIT